jgi:hypothetical protein
VNIDLVDPRTGMAKLLPEVRLLHEIGTDTVGLFRANSHNGLPYMELIIS